MVEKNNLFQNAEFKESRSGGYCDILMYATIHRSLPYYCQVKETPINEYFVRHS